MVTTTSTTYPYTGNVTLATNTTGTSWAQLSNAPITSGTTGTTKIALSEEVVDMQTILEHPVFKSKVSELKTAWLARFGSGWVRFDQVENDDYFKFAAQRLVKMGKLEMHAVNETSSWSPVHMMRLIKDE